MKPFTWFGRQHAGLIVLGAVHALSFAPNPLPLWALPFVQIFSLAVLAWLVFRQPDARAAAIAAGVFGLGNFTVGLYWLYISMHDYGGLPTVLAAIAVVILAVFLALFGALAAGACHALCQRRLRAAAGWPTQLLIAATWASCWTIAEWLRGTLFTGFPWMNIAYAHVEGVLAPWAAVVGAYGVAWLAGFASGAIALLALAKDTGNDARAAVAVGAAILTGLAGIGLNHVDWSRPEGEPILVRLVQGNVPQSEKFDPALIDRGIEDYLRLADLDAKEANAEPQLIVLPETVVPVLQDRVAPALWQRWQAIAQRHDATVLMGVPLHDVEGGRDRYTNSAIAFDAATPLAELVSGRVPQRYDKQHLVPFGEFVPPGFRWFVDAMHIPLGDFDRGEPRQRLFSFRGQWISPDICYEDVFGEEIIETVRDSDVQGPGATILVNMSNLGWFGNSWALRQHLQISRMRARETARPMIRATNTGMTAAIDAKGTIRDVLQPMRKGVLDVEVQGMKGMTPYVQWGNTPVLAAAALVLLLALFGPLGRIRSLRES